MEWHETGLVRGDGRLAVQIRPLSSELRVLNRADGSALFRQGNSSVLVAVYGPTEVKYRDELLDRATLDVVFKQKTRQTSRSRGSFSSFVAAPKEKQFEYLIRNTLDAVIISTLHPRTAINVIIQVLQEDGSILSTAINGACLALLDAGIPMRTLIAAVTLAIKDEETVGGDKSGKSVILIDPTTEEEGMARCKLEFGMTSSVSEGIVLSTTSGRFDHSDYFSCFSVATKASQAILTYFQTTITSRYSHLLSGVHSEDKKALEKKAKRQKSKETTA